MSMGIVFIISMNGYVCNHSFADKIIFNKFFYQ